MRFTTVTSLLAVLEDFAAARVVNDRLVVMTGDMMAQKGRFLEFKQIARYLRLTERNTALPEGVRRRVAYHLTEKFPSHHREILDVAIGLQHALDIRSHTQTWKHTYDIVTFLLLKEPWWLENMSGDELSRLTHSLCRTHNCTAEVATAIRTHVIWLRSAISVQSILSILHSFLKSNIDIDTEVLYSAIIENHPIESLRHVSPQLVRKLASCLMLQPHKELEKYLHEAANNCDIGRASLLELARMLSSLGSLSSFGNYTLRVCTEIEKLVTRSHMVQGSMELDPEVLSPLRSKNVYKKTAAAISAGNKNAARSVLLESMKGTSAKGGAERIPGPAILLAIARSSLETERVIWIANICCLELINNHKEYTSADLASAVTWLADLRLRSPLLLRLATDRCQTSKQMFQILYVLVRMNETSPEPYLKALGSIQLKVVTDVESFTLLVRVSMLVRDDRLLDIVTPVVDESARAMVGTLETLPPKKLSTLFIFLVARRDVCPSFVTLMNACGEYLLQLSPADVPLAKLVFTSLTKIKKTNLSWRTGIRDLKSNAAELSEWEPSFRVGLPHVSEPAKGG